MIAILRRFALASTLVATLIAAPAAVADGTETLGTPTIPISNGTGVVVAGAGTQGHPNGPVSVTVDVPSSALIKQVLVYWEGHVTRNWASPDASISLNGNAVDGQLIGGDTNFFASELFSTYRADVTALNLVKPGANTLTASGMHFDSTFVQPSGNDGIGVVVIYDQGTPSTFVGLKDGQDLAFAEFASPLDTTVPQTFSFAAANVERTASLGVLAGSVAGPDLAGLRGNVITGRFGGGSTFVIAENALQSTDGEEFDAVSVPVTIPAGATSLTIQLLSQGGVRPASLAWMAGTLTVEEPPPPPPGGQGCTPGYWKNHLDSWGPTGYAPTQALSTVFASAGLDGLASNTLVQALKYGGGSSLEAKKKILLRAAVASLLNAAHPGVAFGATAASVISAVNAALESDDVGGILALANELDDRNNAGCKLN